VNGRDPILNELIDTGASGDGRYWITEVHYVKSALDDLFMQISVTNAGCYGPKAQQ
jgi:hypothetical protein